MLTFHHGQRFVAQKHTNDSGNKIPLKTSIHTVQPHLEFVKFECIPPRVRNGCFFSSTVGDPPPKSSPRAKSSEQPIEDRRFFNEAGEETETIPAGVRGDEVVLATGDFPACSPLLNVLLAGDCSNTSSWSPPTDSNETQLDATEEVRRWGATLLLLVPGLPFFSALLPWPVAGDGLPIFKFVSKDPNQCDIDLAPTYTYIILVKERCAATDLYWHHLHGASQWSKVLLSQFQCLNSLCRNI